MSNFLRRVAAVIALGLLAACSRPVSVKIGVAAPMSGPLAQYGRDLARGAEVAVEQLNNEKFTIDGKRAHLELMIEDDKASIAEGKLVAQRLIDAGVSGVIGHWNSGVSIATAGIYAQASIPQLSVSTNVKYTRMGFKTAFRIAADDTRQSTTLSRLILDRLRAKSIYMIDDGTEFGLGLMQELRAIFMKKDVDALQESLKTRPVNYPALAQRIVNAHADVVFFSGDEVAGLPLLKALRAAGSPARFVTGDAMCDPTILKNAAGLADSSFFCSVTNVPPSWLTAGIAFSQIYKLKFGAPGIFSSPGYDAVHILAQAMQEAHSSNPAQYLPTLAKGTFDGKVQGPVEFDAKGDLKENTVVVYEAVGGQLTEQRDLL